MIDFNIEKTDKNDANAKAIVAYLSERIKTDTNLAEACNKEKKTVSGMMAYIKQEARKQAVNGMAMIDDQTVYGWAVHYIQEDSIEEPEPFKMPDYKNPDTEAWKVVQPKKQYDITQLTFDF